MPHRGLQRTVKRGPPHRTAKERVLVVCEGGYTEPRYFAALSDHLRLNTLAVSCYFAHSVASLLMSSRSRPSISAARPIEIRPRSTASRTSRCRRSSMKS